MKSNIARPNEETMNHRRRRIAPARLAILVVLSLVTVASIVKLSRASIGTVTKADLTGSWQGTFFGNTGCGISTEVFNFTLNSSGSGTASAKYHTAGCGDGTATGLPFTIESLGSNGSGTANLSCGTGCGFNFAIQVSADRATFSMVDVTDPNNFLQGVAIHQ
jgi:hypothetical protein